MLITGWKLSSESLPKLGFMTQTARTQWRAIDNNSLYHPHVSCKVSRDMSQINVLDKSYGKTYGHVHRIYCKNKNHIISSYKCSDHKLETVAHFYLLIANVKHNFQHNHLHNAYSFSYLSILLLSLYFMAGNGILIYR